MLVALSREGVVFLVFLSPLHFTEIHVFPSPVSEANWRSLFRPGGLPPTLSKMASSFTGSAHPPFPGCDTPKDRGCTGVLCCKCCNNVERWLCRCVMLYVLQWCKEWMCRCIVLFVKIKHFNVFYTQNINISPSLGRFSRLLQPKLNKHCMSRRPDWCEGPFIREEKATFLLTLFIKYITLLIIYIKVPRLLILS